MKNQFTTFQLRHEILMSEMQLQSRLAKTLENLLRLELSQVESSFQKKENPSKIELHSKLAQRLEIQLGQALSRVEESFYEMESFSMELLNLQKELLALQKTEEEEEEEPVEPILHKRLPALETVS